MSPVAVALEKPLDTSTEPETVIANGTKLKVSPAAQAAVASSPILYRIPTAPPLTLNAHGIYMECEGGRTIVDAVGGAAVTCIGNGHPKVIEAIKQQAEKLACESCKHCCVMPQ